MAVASCKLTIDNLVSSDAGKREAPAGIRDKSSDPE